MKLRLIAFVSMLLLGLCAEAANYTVKQAGGGTYTTITACINAMAPGDTCTVYAGDYSTEGIHTISAGTAGSYKTVQANTGDVVTTKEWVLNSYTKLIGLTIQDPSTPNAYPCVGVTSAATNVWIQNNKISQCGTMGVQYVSGTPTYVYILNNTITNLCSTLASPNVCLAINTRGDHWLISGNDISHASDAITLLSSYSIYRDNHLHDFLTSECTASVSGGNGSNCHIDLAQTEPTADVKYLVLEGNYGGNNQGGCDPNQISSTQKAAGITCNSTPVPNVNGHGFLVQGDACPAPTASDPYPCAYYIARFNAFQHVAGGMILDDNALRNTNSMGFSHVKVYNNTWVDFNYYSPVYGVTDLFSHYSVNGADKNNLYYYPYAQTSFNPYADDSTTDATFAYGNNLGWCLGADTGTTCNLLGHLYNSGSFTSDPGNIKADPLFTNYASSNFSLTKASPAIGGGSNLTTVASGDSGTGTALLVNDAGFFQDGFGLAGVRADQIRVGTSTVVQITSVNYATNTLNLANSISRSPGDAVYLFSDSTGRVVLYGNTPDIGAFPATLQLPAPPSGLTVSVS